MARAPIPSRRFRISVPEKDEDVIAWFEEQEEISASIRVLVKNFVKKEGVVDVMCRPGVRKITSWSSPSR